MQIEAIRSEMDIEVNRLIAIIHKKNVDLTDLETKLVNRLRWGIVVLQSKNENLIRRQVLQWWRYVESTLEANLQSVLREIAHRFDCLCAGAILLSPFTILLRPCIQQQCSLTHIYTAKIAA